MVSWIEGEGEGEGEGKGEVVRERGGGGCEGERGEVEGRGGR
jgi:hypothetical protein